MTAGQIVLVAAIALALAAGTWRLLSDGRVRGAGAGAVRGESGVLAGTPWAGRLGERATFVQFSSAFCAPCRTTRVVLADLAVSEPGVVHVEVDAEQHLDVVRRLGILRTPTTLVLDAEGREVARAGGVPRREQVRQALAALG